MERSPRISPFRNSQESESILHLQKCDLPSSSARRTPRGLPGDEDILISHGQQDVYSQSSPRKSIQDKEVVQVEPIGWGDDDEDPPAQLQ